MGDWGLDELNRIRARIAVRFGWTDVRPLHPMDPGRAELAKRLVESGAAGEVNLKHVLHIAELEAVTKETVEYLSGKVFELESWRKKLAMRAEDATRIERPRAGPKAAGASIGPAEPQTGHGTTSEPFSKGLS